MQDVIEKVGVTRWVGYAAPLAAYVEHPRLCDDYRQRKPCINERCTFAHSNGELVMMWQQVIGRVRDAVICAPCLRDANGEGSATHEGIDRVEQLMPLAHLGRVERSNRSLVLLRRDEGFGRFVPEHIGRRCGRAGEKPEAEERRRGGLLPKVALRERAARRRARREGALRDERGGVNWARPLCARRAADTVAGAAALREKRVDHHLE